MAGAIAAISHFDGRLSSATPRRRRSIKRRARDQNSRSRADCIRRPVGQLPSAIARHGLHNLDDRPESRGARQNSHGRPPTRPPAVRPASQKRQTEKQRRVNRLVEPPVAFKPRQRRRSKEPPDGRKQSQCDGGCVSIKDESPRAAQALRPPEPRIAGEAFVHIRRDLRRHRAILEGNGGCAALAAPRRWRRRRRNRRRDDENPSPAVDRSRSVQFYTYSSTRSSSPPVGRSDGRRRRNQRPLGARTLECRPI